MQMSKIKGDAPFLTDYNDEDVHLYGSLRGRLSYEEIAAFLVWHGKL